jgi:hypothetical protein
MTVKTLVSRETTINKVDKNPDTAVQAVAALGSTEAVIHHHPLRIISKNNSQSRGVDK